MVKLLVARALNKLDLMSDRELLKIESEMLSAIDRLESEWKEIHNFRTERARTRTFFYHSDRTDGWLKVPKEVVNALELPPLGDLSRQDRDNYYLQWDDDADNFIDKYREVHGAITLSAAVKFTTIPTAKAKR